jgi:hypothetical protein
VTTITGAVATSGTLFHSDSDVSCVARLRGGTMAVCAAFGERASNSAAPA